MDPRNREHLSAERLQAYLDGEFVEGDARSAEEHLATCARCSSELDAWRTLFQDLSDLPEREPAGGFAERVLAQVEIREQLPLVARVKRRLQTLVSGLDEQHLPPERIQDLLDGSLSSRRAARVRLHVDGCATCARELEAWRNVYTGLAGLERFAPAPGFAERVAAGLRIARVPAPVPMWQRAATSARRFVPTSRRAWAAISGVAVTPAVTAVLLLYTVFSHPTLTPQALLSFGAWKLSDLATAGWSRLAAGALDASQLIGVGPLVNAALDAPVVVAAGALAYSVLSVLALRVLYKNLFRGRRYASLSIR